ncbi:MAG: hypothetical protein HWN65_12305 [Candidatus Helarchaeota archaeon]|nr:hypothetical protein [Candidatus Helarchaeota archaeon]
MADVDTKTVGKAFRVEIKGQFLPIKSYSGGDLTAEKAEASSGKSQHAESTMGHNYLAETIGKKVVALSKAGVSFGAIKRVVDNINGSFQFTKKFMKMPIPKLLKNIDYIAVSNPTWPESLLAGKLSIFSGLFGTLLMTIAYGIKYTTESPTGQGPTEVTVLVINIMAFVGLGTGLLAVILGSYFLTRQISKLGFIGLILGGLAIVLFLAPYFITQ